MSVKFQVLKAEDNALNTFLADEDRLDDQVIATLEVNGKTFNAMGDTREDALGELREITDHYNAQKHIAQIEIDKANGQYFFE